MVVACAAGRRRRVAVGRIARVGRGGAGPHRAAEGGGF